MKKKEVANTERVIQKIQLIKGEFSPPEAAQIIMNLIDEKINFHKIQRLQLWEDNHKCKTDQLDKRIEELKKEKATAREFINSIRSPGQSLKINGVIEITITK